MLLKAVVIWLALAVLAVLNGVFRGSVISPRIGEAAAHVASTFIFCAVIFIVTWYTVGWIGPRTGGGALTIGAVWLTMTVAFEFLAGHYLFGNSWEKLLADYNVARGRIWPLVLLSLLLAPRFTAAMKGLLQRPTG